MIDFYIWAFFISCIIFALIVWTRMGLFDGITDLFDDIKDLFNKKKKKHL